MKKRNREQIYNSAMEKASQLYREATVDAWDLYVRSCQLAGEKYKVATGDVIVAQDVCRGEIERAGMDYDSGVSVALEDYIKALDDAIEAYRVSEFRS